MQDGAAWWIPRNRGVSPWTPGFLCPRVREERPREFAVQGTHGVFACARINVAWPRQRGFAAVTEEPCWSAGRLRETSPQEKRLGQCGFRKTVVGGTRACGEPVPGGSSASWRAGRAVPARYPPRAGIGLPHWFVKQSRLQYGLDAYAGPPHS